MEGTMIGKKMDDAETRPGNNGRQGDGCRDKGWLVIRTRKRKVGRHSTYQQDASSKG